MPELRTVGEVANEFSIPPRVISDLFYSRALDNIRCPLVGNRRLIPVDYLPEIQEVLRERGIILETEAVYPGTIPAERPHKTEVEKMNFQTWLRAKGFETNKPGQLSVKQHASLREMYEAEEFKKRQEDQELQSLRAMRPMSRNSKDQVIVAAICQTLKLRDVERHFDEQTLEAADRDYRHGIGLQQILFRAAKANGRHSVVPFFRCEFSVS